MTPAAPPLRWLALRLPKGGCGDDEYEDAWAAEPARGRFAVADGASESSFAGLWSRLLAAGFVAARRPPELASWLDGPRRRWAEAVMPLDLPWYAEIKREEGAFAAFLGLSVRGPAAGKPGGWRAVAVGDACLVQVRGGREARSFPVRRSSDFGNQPRLIGSRRGPTPEPEECAGSLRPGDRLFLMTDALAQWFLAAHEHGRRPWDAAARLWAAKRREAAFTAWVEKLRRRGGLRNDDVTLLMIEPSPTPKE
jgi:hypothetical protein